MTSFEHTYCSFEGMSLVPIDTRDNSPIEPSLSRTSYPCPEWEEKLVYMHPDDLTEAERMELFKHISHCSACTTFRRHYRAVNEIIRDLPFQEEIPNLELPAKLRHLWEFEDIQKDPSRSREEALPCQTPLVESEVPLRECEVSQETYQKKSSNGNWVRVFFLSVAAYVLSRVFSLIWRNRPFRKWRLTAQHVTDEDANCTPKKEPGTVTI